MLISLHKQTTTMPKILAAIQDDVRDRSHTPHRLQTTLIPPQEAVISTEMPKIRQEISPVWTEAFSASGSEKRKKRAKVLWHEHSSSQLR